jgi:hypothetical protein
MEMMEAKRQSLVYKMTQDSRILPQDRRVRVLVFVFNFCLVSLGVLAVQLFSGSRFPGSLAVGA